MRRCWWGPPPVLASEAVLVGSPTVLASEAVLVGSPTGARQ